MSYKKRAKIGWQDGKEYKKESNDSERMFAKKEIAQEELEIIQGDSFKTKGRVKGKLTKKERLQKKIAWYERTVEKWEGESFRLDSWCLTFISRMRSNLKKFKKQLEVL